MADSSSPEQLKEKLARALRAKAVLAEKSRLLEQQVADSRHREDVHNHVVSELLDRQREANFMLHRANSVLHRFQETNMALSSEFTELVKELPAPNAPDWEERVAKINDLFRRTGELADEVQDEIFRKGSPSEPPNIATEQERPPVQAKETPIPEPAQIEESPQPEPAEAEVTSEPVLEPEPVEQVDEPASDSVDAPILPESIDAEFTSEDKDPEREQRLERLFQRLETVEPDLQRPVTLVDLDETRTRPERKPGVFSRMFRKRRAAENHEDESSIDKAS